MWKIFFEYKDGSKVTITGKKTVTEELLMKYWLRYGVVADTAIFQQYPKKKHTPISIMDKIAADFGTEYAEKAKEIQRQVLLVGKMVSDKLRGEKIDEKSGL